MGSKLAVKAGDEPGVKIRDAKVRDEPRVKAGDEPGVTAGVVQGRGRA